MAGVSYTPVAPYDPVDIRRYWVDREVGALQRRSDRKLYGLGHTRSCVYYLRPVFDVGHTWLHEDLLMVRQDGQPYTKQTAMSASIHPLPAQMHFFRATFTDADGEQMQRIVLKVPDERELAIIQRGIRFSHIKRRVKGCYRRFSQSTGLGPPWW